MSKIALVLGTTIYTCLAIPASACQSSSFILDETFKSPDSGWDAQSERVTYGSDGASVKSTSNTSYFSANTNYTSDNTDICAEIIWPSQLNEVNNKMLVYGGIIFWMKDYNNFYVVQVDAMGNVGVSRLVANKWSLVAVKKDLNIARLSPSDKNEIEVQITGSHATFRLNGKPAAEINGQPPSGGGYVGIYAGMSDPALPIVFPRFKLATMP